METVHISVVSPVYRAELMVDELVKRLKESLSEITDSYEIVLVDDRSPDGSWERISALCKTDDRIKGIRLSRNFGQHYAITAGLDAAHGEWVVVMDCDLQDVPEEIGKLYNKALEGYDIVLAQRVVRHDGVFKKMGSYLFYTILGYLSGMKQDSSIANFGIYNKKVISIATRIREKIRYFPTMIRWVGFNSTSVPVTHAKRGEGKTSYNFSRLFRLGLDIILAHSDKPLRLTIKLGLLISLCSFAFALTVLYKYLTHKIIVLGYSSLIISIWFLSGIIIMIMGVIGLYIGKIFEGVKDRPIYIVDQNINL